MRNKRGKGFTLIEIVLVIALLSFLMSMGLFFDTHSYRRFSFTGEQSLLVSLLSRVRSEAMANVDGKAHGLCLTNDSHEYILFEGDFYSAGNPKNISVSGNKDVSVSASPNTFLCSSGQGVVFSQLTGNALPVDIVLSQNNRTSTTSINHEGTIIW